ncbi:MAG TPA: flavin reductase [Cyclobacteriaceae bacterium]|nr:flavin reductase [Cyclobacteriaceae bacterium]
MKLHRAAILDLPQRYRANLINSLAGIRQVALIGTQSPAGQNNLAIFNSLLHVGANPPLYALLFRPETVRRDTLSNILDTGFYTINYVRSTQFSKAHQTSAKYEHQEDEFEKCGFKAEFKDAFKAPYVVKAPVQIGMQLQERVDLKINGTIMIIGSLEHIYLDENLIASDGLVDLASTDILACQGLYQYYQVKEIARLPYAKPL